MQAAPAVRGSVVAPRPTKKERAQIVDLLMAFRDFIRTKDDIAARAAAEKLVDRIEKLGEVVQP